MNFFYFKIMTNYSVPDLYVLSLTVKDHDQILKLKKFILATFLISMILPLYSAIRFHITLWALTMFISNSCIFSFFLSCSFFQISITTNIYYTHGFLVCLFTCFTSNFLAFSAQKSGTRRTIKDIIVAAKRCGLPSCLKCALKCRLNYSRSLSPFAVFLKANHNLPYLCPGW